MQGIEKTSRNISDLRLNSQDHENEICFVIRPFSNDFQNVWDLAIRPALETSGLEAWDGQEERLGTNVIHADISKLVWAAKLVIADISSLNPNVMYELGLAHSAKKPVIILLEENETPPFNLAHIRYLEYNSNRLKELYENLVKRIETEILTPNVDRPDFFPELKIFTPELIEEFEYLRSKLVECKVKVTPSCAEIFFNDKLIGRGEVDILINPNSPRNTISAATVGFFDYHRQLEQADIKCQSIQIELEKTFRVEEKIDARVSQRLPAWLRDRRRDPENPVLMKAVSNYLLLIGERTDAFYEIEELISSAPGWHLSYIQMGFYHGVADGIAEAIPWYRKAASLCDYHYIASYSIACNLSILGELQSALDHLHEIVIDVSKLESIRVSLDCLSRDEDFKNLWMNPETREDYIKIEKSIFPDAFEPEVSVQKGIEGYIF